MSFNTNNRIDDYLERNSFRLAEPLNTHTQRESLSTPNETCLNAFRPSPNKRALKGSREKEPGNLNKQIAIIKEQNYD
jgi:hypothetical protein